MDIVSLSWRSSGQGESLITYHLLVLRLNIGGAVPLLLLWAFMACRTLPFYLVCSALLLALFFYQRHAVLKGAHVSLDFVRNFLRFNCWLLSKTKIGRGMTAFCWEV